MSRSGAALWILAVILMLSAAVYQRLTGPTHPFRGEVTVGEDSPATFRLPRSSDTRQAARVALPVTDPEATALLHYRRYPVDEPFTTVEMRLDEGEEGAEWVAGLPIQPAAGKMEYRVTVEAAGESQRIPGTADGEETIVLRYKDPVPTPLLIAHVAFMFFAVLTGMRAGLGALFRPRRIRLLSWATLGLMTVGGMILGPFVQKYAFGAYWTGFPWGYDLTDNKTLLMWLVWVVACLALGWRASEEREKRPVVRGVVAAAAVVMTVVYLIPHSMRGSELDYEAGSPSALVSPPLPAGPGDASG